MSTPTPRRYRILMVDDDAHFRNGIRRTLTLGEHRDRFELREAGSGTEGVALLEQEPVDCILLDYQMPGGDGMEWLDRILERQRDMAIVMVTGEGNEEVAVQAMKRGAMDYLVKGAITPETLIRALSNAIEKRNLHKALADQQRQLLEAEKQRVMIESLGAACHHIGQPATVIATYLQLMRRQEQTPELRAMLEACFQAAEQIEEILKKLQTVSTYRTVPYRPAGEGESSRPDEFILAI